MQKLRKEILLEALAEYAHEAWSGWMKYQWERAAAVARYMLCSVTDLLRRGVG